MRSDGFSYAFRRFISRDARQPWLAVFASSDPHSPWDRGPRDLYDPTRITVPPYLHDNAVTRRNLAAYFAESTWLPATNPTILIAVDRIRYDYVDPRWMLATLVLFPMLAALWLLMLAPGVNVLNGRWKFSAPAIAVIAIFGAWFAAAGTGLLTWLYARHTGSRHSDPHP